MRFLPRLLLALSASLALLSLLPAAAPPPKAAPPPLSSGHARDVAQGLEVFRQHVRPALTQRCARCHGGDKTRGALDMTTREGLLKGGENGAVLLPGKAPQGKLYRLAAHLDDPHMPPTGPGLSAAQREHLRRWIELGAPYDKPLLDRPEAPRTLTVTDEDRSFWSFRPPCSTRPRRSSRSPPWPATRSTRSSSPSYRRLEAECVRDALLAVSGQLDRRMFGPGTLDLEHRRWSIYFFVKRSQLVPMMVLFDGPAGGNGVGRSEGVTVRGRGMAGGTIVIGDIHGCLAALAALLDATEPGPEDTVVTLGDYIDRGPQSRGVLDRLLALAGRCKLVPLLRNHEEALLDALRDKNALRKWLTLGGADTLRSYGWAPGGPRRALADWLPRQHREFLARCLPYHETDTHLFVHAGFVPELPLAEQPGLALRWRVTDPGTARPHCSGKVAVVGHTPQLSGEVLDLGFLVCIDTNCVHGGWLTALDITTGRVWQADRAGRLRGGSGELR